MRGYNVTRRKDCRLRHCNRPNGRSGPPKRGAKRLVELGRYKDIR